MNIHSLTLISHTQKEVTMITLTQAAIAHIQSILKNKGKNAAFRLSVKKTGCSGYQYVPEITEIKKRK